MSGWVIFHKNKRLVKEKYWGLENDAQGWIWTDYEKDSILQNSQQWQFKPTHIQKAVLIGQTTTLLGNKIPV